MTEPDAGVVSLAEARARARATKDFAAADALRDELAAAGWTVVDEPDGGWRLEPAPAKAPPAAARSARRAVAARRSPRPTT